MWWVVVLVGAASAARWRDENNLKNKSEGWMNSLRGRLMRDNYDYEASSADQVARAGAPDPPADPADGKPTDVPDYPSGDSADDERAEQPDNPPDSLQFNFDAMSGSRDPLLVTTVNSLYVPRFRADDAVDPREAPAEQSPDADEHGISRNDLLYYVDDTRLRLDSPNNELENQLDSGRYPMALPRVEDPPKNVSYKLIKLAGLSRRGGPSPRFVAEHGADGVALLSLDGAPFPQFRLPAPRRRYSAWLD